MYFGRETRYLYRETRSQAAGPDSSAARVHAGHNSSHTREESIGEVTHVGSNYGRAGPPQGRAPVDRAYATHFNSRTQAGQIRSQSSVGAQQKPTGNRRTPITATYNVASCSIDGSRLTSGISFLNSEGQSFHSTHSLCDSLRLFLLNSSPDLKCIGSKL